MRTNKPITPLLTPWGEAADKSKPLNDYPRPQLMRKEWQCLNGPWDYAITADKHIPETWDGEIIVPFSPETILSDVQRQLLPGQTLWYRRKFDFEKCKQGERLLLHFGAVDQHCTVYINGKKAGSHSGGYWPFSFDISGFINSDKTEILIEVTDDTDTGDEAYGKQTLNRGEIWYTGQSGIWQTVWCELVPAAYIEKINITPHYQTGEVEFSVFINTPDSGGKDEPPHNRDDIRIKIFDSGALIAEGTLKNNPLIIKMPAGFKSWSPEHPFLYDVEIRAGEDTVTSYFGMREFGIVNGKHGPVLSLNGEPLFHNGLLDQGYWSDGMYTPPSDEAMVWEIKKLKDMGFNMLRKHIKIEPLRWYYHCDKIGMLVWQDFVSGGGPYKPFVVQYAPWLGFNFKDTKKRYALHGRKSDTGRRVFLRDAERTVDLLYNTVGISVWVPFNEGWGQFDAASMAERVHKKDPTRPIDHASGYFDQGAGDFHSYHIYFKSFRPKPDRLKRVLALTEFGGFSLAVDGHTSSDILYGYKMFKDKQSLNDGVRTLYANDVFPAMEKGLSAAIYTQVSDVEDEVNGIFTYDRRETKLDPSITVKIARTLHELFKKTTPVIKRPVSPAESKSKSRRLSKKQLLYGAGALLLALCLGAWLSLFLPFPELDAFIQRDWSTRVYDRGGNLIQILALENGIRREFTAYEAMPPDAIRVFLAAEDKDFFTHRGIDIAAIARAAYQNISSGKRVSGASTVTMQLARLVIPAKRRTFFAKLREARNALRIERRLSKRDILELYLNSIPFGFQTEGLTSAARNFFSLPLSEITSEQLCCLAVIPRRPAGYNPLEHPEACAEKAAVLYRSVFEPESGRPNSRQESQPDTLIEDRLLQAARTARRFEYPFNMPHYIEYLVRRYKAGDFYPQTEVLQGAQGGTKPQPEGSPEIAQGSSPPQRNRQIQTAHRSVPASPKAAPQQALPPDWYLTADSDLSAQGEFLLQAQLKANPQARVRNGAVLIIENATGNILAWVGSNSYFDDESNGKIDGVTALNQSGSSSKPFLYGLALEKGWKPSDVLPDIPMRFGREEAYIPRNFNNRFNGPVRLRVALASSLNIPAVYLLNEIGAETYLQTLEQLGFQSIGTKGDEAGLSLALGSVPVPLYELVRAFSVFPRDGILLPLRSFTDGSIADGFSEPRTVYSADTARLICSILSDSAARAKGFGFSSTFKTPFPSIFKTGTANQFQSLVALAASSAFTVGVWMGNFAGDTVMGKTGSSAPAAIARDLLVRLHSRPLADGTLTPAQSFAEPEHWRRESVCALSGMPAGSACPNTVQEYLPSAFDGYHPFDTAGRHGTYERKNAQYGQGSNTYKQEGGGCTWHRMQNGHTVTVYPEEYRRWFANSTRHGTIGRPSNALTVIRPADGSHFVGSPDSGSIPIEITGGAEDTVQVEYDSLPPFILNRPFSGSLPSEKGEHSLSVRCGDEEVSVTFTVE